MRAGRWLALAAALAALGPVAEAASTLAGHSLALDAGHGGDDPGASGFGLLEKDVNLDVVLRARDLLEADGATMLLTRDCDCTVSLGARTGAANDAGVERFVSVHSNACGGCGGHGTETYYHTSLPGTSTAAALAGLAQEEVVAHLGTRDRGVKQADFYVLRNTAMPAVLVELAFVDHAGDNDILASPTMRQEAARGILHAVQRHFGVPAHDPAPSVPFAVQIVRPAATDWLRGTVTAEGSTTHETNLAWMRFLLDGAVAKWVTPTPHHWAWDTTQASDGTHALDLQGKDTAGTLAFDSVKVRIDNTPPDVAITAPRPGTANVNGLSAPLPAGLVVATGLVPVRADASDPAPGSGVARVVFSVDGAPRATILAPPFAWSWPAHDEALGDHTLAAQAWDVAGNARTASLRVHLTAPTTPAGVAATLAEL